MCNLNNKSAISTNVSVSQPYRHGEWRYHSSNTITTQFAFNIHRFINWKHIWLKCGWDYECVCMFARDVHKLKMANFQFNVNYTKVSDPVPSNLHDSNGDIERDTWAIAVCFLTGSHIVVYMWYTGIDTEM